MNQEINLPVLICAYSRDVEFLDVLATAIEFGCKRIYINLDGTRNPEILISQNSMIDMVREVKSNFPEVEISLRRSYENLGAACSLISSLDWFFSREEFGVILEDDLQFDGSLFRFMSWASDKFENDTAVWILSGSNFLSSTHDLRGHLQFPNYPVTWGWATWQAKWQEMRTELLRNPEFISPWQFDAVLNFWGIGARRAKTGLIDAWDIPLAEIMQRLGKMSLVSPINLVRNIGYSELASNTSQNLYPLDIHIDSEGMNYDFESCLSVEPLRGGQINSIYESDVYGISLRNRFTSILSVFDFLRFKKENLESLATRLSRQNESIYETF